MNTTIFQAYKSEIIGGEPKQINYFIDRETITNNGAGIYAYLVPTGVDSVMAWLECDNAVGRVEYTLSNLFHIKNDTAIWRPWKHGNVSAAAMDTMFPAMAFRAYKVTGSGSISLEMKAE